MYSSSCPSRASDIRPASEKADFGGRHRFAKKTVLFGKLYEAKYETLCRHVIAASHNAFWMYSFV